MRALEVRLLERGSSAPVVGASVDVYEQGAQARRVQSDERGTFRPGAAALDDVVLDILSPSHMARRATLARVVASGEPPTIWLDPAGVVDVYVLSETGEPIVGALVEIQPADRSRLESDGSQVLWPDFQPPGRAVTALAVHTLIPSGTDAAGHVRIPYMPCDWPLVARATWNVPDTRAPFSISSVERRAEVTLRVAQFAELEGEIRWSDGAPASGLVVTLFSGNSSTLASEANVAQDGSFRFSRVPVGWVEWRPALDGEPARGLQVVAPMTRAETLTLPRRHTLRGRWITREPGTSERSCFVELVRDGRRTASVSTARDGSFSLLALAGTSTLLVRRAEGLPVVRELEVDVPCEPLELDLTKFTCGLRFLPVGVDVGERVEVGHLHVDAEGRALGTATVGATDDSARALDARFSDVEWKDGQVVLSGLAPGTLRAWIDCGPRGGARLPEVMLRAGQSLDLGSVVIGSGTLEIRVVDMEDVPVGGLALRVTREREWRAKENAKELRTDAAGVARLEALLPGDYVVAAACDVGRLRFEKSVGVDAGGTTRIELRVAATGRIRGSVKARERLPDGARIELSGPGSTDGTGAPLATPISSEGQFAFDAVPAGDYQLRLTTAKLSLARGVRVIAGQVTDVVLGTELDPRTVTLLWEGLPDRAAVHATVSTSEGWARLEPADGVATYQLPPDMRAGIFVVARRGVPGAGYAGHPRITVRQTAAVAVCDLGTGSRLDVELSSTVPRCIVAAVNDPPPDVRIVGFEGCAVLERLALPAGLQPTLSAEGWACHALSPGLVLELVNGGSTRRLVVGRD